MHSEVSKACTTSDTETAYACLAINFIDKETLTTNAESSPSSFPLRTLLAHLSRRPSWPSSLLSLVSPAISANFLERQLHQNHVDRD